MFKWEGLALAGSLNPAPAEPGCWWGEPGRLVSPCEQKCLAELVPLVK